MNALFEARDIYGEMTSKEFARLGHGTTPICDAVQIIRDVAAGLVARRLVAALIAQVRCTCGGAFPCARRHWWNSWRHNPTVKTP